MTNKTLAANMQRNHDLFMGCRKLITAYLIVGLMVGEWIPVSLAQGQNRSFRMSERFKSSRSSFADREEVTCSPERRETPEELMFGKSSSMRPIYTGLAYQVHILGEVHKAGTFRVSPSSRLSEALDQAGGTTEQGSERFVELRRAGKTKKVDLLSFRLLGDLDGNPYLLDNDVVFVPLRSKIVEIEGTIKRAGLYELREERSLEDVITLAGGFTASIGNSAFLQVIRFVNGTKTVIDVENTKEAREKFLIENADVIVCPSLLTANRKFDFNVSTLPGDGRPFYPSYEDRVFVLGAVEKPGPYNFSPYFGVPQYLTLAGGANRLSKRKQITVASADGTTSKWTSETTINPGDTIYVPQKYMSPESLISLILGITASILGITTTVVALTR